MFSPVQELYQRVQTVDRPSVFHMNLNLDQNITPFLKLLSHPTVDSSWTE